MQQILTGTVQASPFLIGRKGFFFDPPDDTNGNQSGAPAQQGQQQQQQPAAFVSPFEGMDRSLLDDQVRERIEKAETSLRDLNGRAAQASQYQSTADRLKAENDRILQELQRTSAQQQQPNGQQQQPPTFVQELEQEYLKAGLPPENAKKAAEIQANVLGKFSERFQTQQDRRYAPVLGNVVDSTARSAFEQAIQNDTHNLIQSNPQLAEALWAKVNEMAGQGQLVNTGVVQNLARIMHFDFQQSNQEPGQANNQQFQQQQQPPPMPPINGGNGANGRNVSTQFTYPGAGIYVRPPQQQVNPSDQMDSDTYAALGAVTSGWNKQPKAFANFPKQNAIRITRDGK